MALRLFTASEQPSLFGAEGDAAGIRSNIERIDKELLDYYTYLSKGMCKRRDYKDYTDYYFGSSFFPGGFEKYSEFYRKHLNRWKVLEENIYDLRPHSNRREAFKDAMKTAGGKLKEYYDELKRLRDIEAGGQQ